VQDRYKKDIKEAKIMATMLQRYAQRGADRAPEAQDIPGTAGGKVTAGRKVTAGVPGTPLMGPADNPAAIPVMGPADSTAAIPIMGPSGTGTAVPVMGAGAPAAISLLGPPDSATAIPVMSPRR
jgi:hypothetical protein